MTTLPGANPLNRQPNEWLNLIERAFIRVEAEQLISLCLEENDPTLLQRTIENLVLEGTASLGILREIREEVRTTRISLSQQVDTLRLDLTGTLEEFGLLVPGGLRRRRSLREYLRALRGLDTSLLEKGNPLSLEDEILITEICEEVKRRSSLISRKISTMNLLDQVLQDWIRSLAFQASYQGRRSEGGDPTRRLH